jgi:hypothetical protein
MTFYAYVKTVTLTPSFTFEVRRGAQTGGDADRTEVGGSVVSSSGSVVSLSTSDNGTWVAWTCNLATEIGYTYFLILKNTSADPVANYATFVYRGELQSFSTNILQTKNVRYFQAGYTINGFTADPTALTAIGPCVVKFSDGALMGNPFVASETPPANTNSRGNKFTVPVNADISFVDGFGSTAISNYGFYNATSGAQMALAVSDFPAFYTTYRCPSTTFVGGTAYYLVQNMVSSSNAGRIFNMGEALENVPADVLACRPFGLTYVTGTTAQRDSGTMTEDASKFFDVSFAIDDFWSPEAGAAATTRGWASIG